MSALDCTTGELVFDNRVKDAHQLFEQEYKEFVLKKSEDLEPTIEGQRPVIKKAPSTSWKHRRF